MLPSLVVPFGSFGRKILMKRKLFFASLVVFAVLAMALAPVYATGGDEGRPGETVTPDAPAAGPAAGTVDSSSSDQDVPTRDQVILDDLIVEGSACIGFDCVNGESFGSIRCA